jgi:hypothetical protein
LLTEEIARLMDCPSRAVEEHEGKRDSLQYRLFKFFHRRRDDPPLRIDPGASGGLTP